MTDVPELQVAMSTAAVNRLFQAVMTCVETPCSTPTSIVSENESGLAVS